jgi:dipeptidyl-peptidase-4
MRMPKIGAAALAALALSPPGGAEDMVARYQRAIDLLPWNVAKRVHGLDIEPRWTGDGATFTYEISTPSGNLGFTVDPAKGVRQPAAAGSPDEATAPGETRSPDGRWRLRTVGGNLVAISSATGEERALTRDAEPDLNYGLPPDSDLKSILRARGKAPLEPTAVWSPDGERFIACHTDQRGLRLIPTVINIRPGEAHQIPFVHQVRTGMPGDDRVPTCRPIVLEPATGRRVDVDLPPLMVVYGSLPFGEFQWNASGTRFYAMHESRDFRTRTAYEVDAATGKSHVIVVETSALPLRLESPSMMTPVDDGKRLVLHSARDGWAHLYLYDTATGKLRNRITRGDWVVRDVKHVDAQNGWLYFTAAGRERGRDPYYAHLYRVRLDGSRLTLLTPEDSHHRVEISPDGRYFVDTHSTVSQPPVTLLRASDGREVMELARADVSALTATGWVPPQRVKVKADDGRTDLFGTLFFPADFDPSRRYPIVNSIYAGPQTTWAPVSFLKDAEEAFGMAQLGFLVLVLDARGTPWRSQAFQDVEFGEGFGAPAIVADHVAAMRQLAQRHPYVDVDRAGMYGYSWGGYRTARAMMQFPEFFKVGVAAAGSHDNFNYVFEHDRWFGRPQDYPNTYTAQSNLPLAVHLKGKLLLAHGDVDDDVHVANTLQLADALIRANKDFDLFIYPDRGHEDMYHDGYFIRRKWDYFVKHLLGEDPPAGVRIESRQH